MVVADEILDRTDVMGQFLRERRRSTDRRRDALPQRVEVVVMNQGIGQGRGVNRQITLLFVMVTVAVLLLASSSSTFGQGGKPPWGGVQR
jgi:hypothetical protein